MMPPSHVSTALNPLREGAKGRILCYLLGIYIYQQRPRY